MPAQPGVDPRPEPTRARVRPHPIGVPGMALCRRNATAACRAPHKVHAGLPREERCGLLFRLRGRPPARHRRGRSPLNQPTSDHADGATLGRWDDIASQLPRRPGIRAGSETAAGISVLGNGRNNVTAADCCRGRCRCPLPQSRIRPRRHSASVARPGPEAHRLAAGRMNGRSSA